MQEEIAAEVSAGAFGAAWITATRLAACLTGALYFDHKIPSVKTPRGRRWIRIRVKPLSWTVHTACGCGKCPMGVPS